MKLALCIALSYLLGSISPSIIQGRMHGIDIKKEGSGNAGATNTLRVLGKKAALISFVIDVLKGFAAVKLGGALAGPVCSYLCAYAVFAGHIWPVFYRFKGGKGVSTAFGAVLALDWRLALIGLAAMVIVTAISRYVSLGSICGVVAMTAATSFLKPDFALAAAAIMLTIIFKHKANIQRLLRGEESKLSFKGKK